MWYWSCTLTDLKNSPATSSIFCSERPPVEARLMFGSVMPLPVASIIELRGSLLRFSLVIFPAVRVIDRIVLGISGLVGGMMYSISVLPAPLRFLARLIPVTYSLEGMRAALLAGAGWRQLWPSLGVLLLFAAILIPLSFLVFAWALRRTKVTGTLTHI